MSSSNCCFLIYIQISQEAGQVVWYSHLFQNFPQFIVIHTVKGFGLVRKAEIDVFLELSCFFDDPADVGNLISGSSAFSKSSLNIWKFLVHVLLKPGLENFEHYFAIVWDECNCVVAQTTTQTTKQKNCLSYCIIIHYVYGWMCISCRQKINQRRARIFICFVHWYIPHVWISAQFRIGPYVSSLFHLQ